MIRHKLKKHKFKQHNRINAQGGLMKRKAEKDRLIFICSTISWIIRVYKKLYKGISVGIDSS